MKTAIEVPGLMDLPEPSLVEAEWTEQDLESIQEELNCILGSHHFLSSRRCQSFLRYAVSEVVSGRRDLKERSIGIEVFHRNPTYDTNQDPVVRMTAGEVRKRLALYYQDGSHHSGLRLELPVGCYAPRIRFSRAVPVPSPPEDPLDLPTLLGFASQPTASARPSVGSTAKERPMRRAVLMALVLIIPVTLAGWDVHRTLMRQSPLQEFWSPFVKDPNPIFLSIGQIRPTSAEVEPNSSRSSVRGAIALQGPRGYPREIAVTVLSDALAMTNITSLLRADGKQVSIHPESTTSLGELERGPFVLVGAFDNDWSMMFSDPLRYHFQIDKSDGSQWIADREHPQMKIGLARIGTAVEDLKSDYAIAARFYDPRTKQTIVIAAGITPFGTQAVGEFLTDPAAIAELVRKAPADWSHKNLEVIVRTDLVDSEAGPPVLVSSTFW